MDKARREAISELLSNADGLIQLASWQLALAREMRTRIAGLAGQPADEQVVPVRPVGRRGRRGKPN